MEYNTPVPVRRGTPCPFCRYGIGTFFTTWHNGPSLRALYHCSGRHCSRFFIHSFPKPDFHSVKITSMSPAREVSVTVTLPEDYAMTGRLSQDYASSVTPLGLKETKALVLMMGLGTGTGGADSYARVLSGTNGQLTT
jgi:hypothetical protein